MMQGPPYVSPEVVEWVGQAARRVLTSYQIVIPSKERPKNMPRMLRFFPHARVYVDRVEEQNYAPFVPPEQLVLHPSLPNQQQIMNWAMDKESAECLVFCDDDLQWVKSMVCTWPRKEKEARITSTYDIVTLVENAVNLLVDEQMYLYGWSMQPHPVAYTNCEPYSLSKLVQACIVMRGRKYRFDEKTDHFDADIVLNVLLKDRICWKDNRFYWNFGVASGNEGGQQSVQQSLTWERQRQYMQRKWGKYISFEAATIMGKISKDVGGPKSQQGFGLYVARRSPLAVRK